MFAYPDAARYRLGTNYQLLPTNRARCAVYCPYQRDGFMNFGDNYGDDPNYVGSMLRPVEFATGKNGPISTTTHEHERWIGEVVSYSSKFEKDDFTQATML